MEDYGYFYGLDGVYDPFAFDEWTTAADPVDLTPTWDDLPLTSLPYDTGSDAYSSGGDGIYNPAGDTYAVDATGDITSIL